MVRKAHSVVPIRVGIGDSGYDSERNHRLLNEELGAISMIPPHTEGVSLWSTEGLYRKEMKRRFSERVYRQRAKDEATFSVVKRTMGDEMRSVRAKGLINEISEDDSLRRHDGGIVSCQRVSTGPGRVAKTNTGLPAETSSSAQ